MGLMVLGVGNIVDAILKQLVNISTRGVQLFDFVVIFNGSKL